MRRETHKRIVRAVAEYLNLDKEQTRILADSCARFDEEESRRRYRHHISMTYNYNRVVLFIKKARELRLRGDLSNSLSELGKALHLVHDSFIPSPSKRSRRLHDELENALVRQKVPREAVEKGFSERPRTFNELKSMLKSTTNLVVKDPKNIMFITTYLSIAIVSSVLLEINPPRELMEELNRLGKPCYERLQLETIKNLALLISLPIIILYIFAYPSIISAIFLAVPASIYAITRLLIRRLAKMQPEASNLSKCTKLIEEITWFGLKVEPNAIRSKSIN